MFIGIETVIKVLFTFFASADWEPLRFVNRKMRTLVENWERQTLERVRSKIRKEREVREKLLALSKCINLSEQKFPTNSLELPQLFEYICKHARQSFVGAYDKRLEENLAFISALESRSGVIDTEQYVRHFIDILRHKVRLLEICPEYWRMTKRVLMSGISDSLRGEIEIETVDVKPTIYASSYRVGFKIRFVKQHIGLKMFIIAPLTSNRVDPPTFKTALWDFRPPHRILHDHRLGYMDLRGKKFDNIEDLKEEVLSVHEKLQSLPVCTICRNGPTFDGYDYPYCWDCFQKMFAHQCRACPRVFPDPKPNIDHIFCPACREVSVDGLMKQPSWVSDEQYKARCRQLFEPRRLRMYDI
jgi:hypothetical protein